MLHGTLEKLEQPELVVHSGHLLRRGCLRNGFTVIVLGSHPEAEWDTTVMKETAVSVCTRSFTHVIVLIALEPLRLFIDRRGQAPATHVGSTVSLGS